MKAIDWIKKVILLSLLICSPNALALNQFVKQWLAVSVQNPLGENKPFLSFFYSELQIIDQSHPWQGILFEGGVGHKLNENNSIWAGYRWTGRDPYNGFTQENWLFQQWLWDRSINPSYKFIIRSRLEEINNSNNQQVGLRLRERFAIDSSIEIFKNAFPFVYNEFFFQITHRNYQPRGLIGENRLFLGFNLYKGKKNWWEIGYLNQFQIRTPQQNQNRMSHILSVTYNFS